MPSARRTVFLPPAFLPSALELVWPAKDPGATLDFTLDATPFLDDAGGDTIVASSIEIASVPTDLTFTAPPACTGTAITWLIGDGTPGGPTGGNWVTNYAVRIYFETEGGLIITCTVWLPIRVLAPPPLYVNNG